MEQKELKTPQELSLKFAEEIKQVKLNNWNHTIDSIERNIIQGSSTAWSNEYLKDDQIAALQEKGYTVEVSVTNGCHKITW